jgi:hypothetical protein
MQAVKTVEFPFETLLTTLATNTTLGTATEHTFTAVTVGLPESSKTIRSAYIQITHNLAATTTARRLDGMRVGVQIDAVAFDDGTDLTGTGIGQTGDPYSHPMTRDVTSYFTANYTGTSHTVGVRVRVEHDVVDTVNNITCKLFITYEYDDTSATQVKTVRILLESAASFPGTVANTNLRGSASSAQIPNLDTFLPETSKTYRQIWFEIHATDGGAAVTDFNLNVAIDSGTNARTTIEGGLNGSARYYDIWIQNSMTTNATHDFQAWSSLASRFQNVYVIMHVTYEFAASSTTIMNSIMVPIKAAMGYLAGTAIGDQEIFDTELWIEEPATITMVQSGVVVFMSNGNGTLNIECVGSGAAGGDQGTTTAAYTITNLTHSGGRSVAHRIDLAHGGTALTLGRGRNVLRLKIYGSTATAVADATGYWYINYTSGKSSKGIGAHNCTTRWMINDGYSSPIAGSGQREIATTNQRTPNIPQTDYFLNAVAYEVTSFLFNTGWQKLMAEVAAGEGPADGWETIGIYTQMHSSELGWLTYIVPALSKFKQHPNDTIYGYMNIETARKYRHYGSTTQHVSTVLILTMHSISFTVDGSITASNGGTVNVTAVDEARGIKVASGSRSGNGSYSMTVYDNVNDHYSEGYESGTYLGRSATGKPNGSP